MLEGTESLLVPAIIVFEVCKRVALQRGKEAAQTALNAALYSAKHQLALAGSLILQIAKDNNATLWTQDIDLKGHDSVQYKAKIT